MAFATSRMKVFKVIFIFLNEIALILLFSILIHHEGIIRRNSNSFQQINNVRQPNERKRNRNGRKKNYGNKFFHMKNYLLFMFLHIANAHNTRKRGKEGFLIYLYLCSANYRLQSNITKKKVGKFLDIFFVLCIIAIFFLPFLAHY